MFKAQSSIKGALVSEKAFKHLVLSVCSKCTHRYQAKCFALTGLASFRGGELPLQCRTLGSRCPRAPPGRWESWNFFLCDGFSIESAWCTVNCVRAQQRGFQLQSNKSTFCTPWSMNEVLKIQKRTLRLFETYRMFLYFYLNLANVVHHRSSELSGKDQGRNTASAWITDSTAISKNTAGI